MSFKKILGQEKAVNALKGFISAARIPRAMLFHGPAGVGKAMSALEFAKTLNCLDADANKNSDNCGVCVNCRHIDARTHPDVIFADFAYQAALRKEELEKQQAVRVDTIRVLTTASQQKAAFAKWKIYVIDSAETMQTEAANALLKFIEEPAPNTVWILVSSKKEAMLGTIKSRCQPLAFSPLPDGIIRDILKGNFVEDSTAEAAARYAQGSGVKAAAVAGVIANISALDDGPGFIPATVLGLPRVLTRSRALVSCMLDMLSVAAHEKWTQNKSDSGRAQTAALLNKLVFYRKALTRNTSPSLVLEAALISAENTGVSIK